MPVMLTIPQAVSKLKVAQPDTPINAATLRRWSKEKRFHSVTVGRKILVSWASLSDFLNGSAREGA